MKKIETPHIPKGKVAICVAAGNDLNLINGLIENNIEVIKTKPCYSIDKAISFHADCLINHFGLSDDGENVIISYCDYLNEEISKLGFKIIKSDFSNKKENKLKYPFDIGLNAVKLKDKLFCLKKYTDKILLKTSLENNIEVVNINQGYSKCNIAIVSENAVITSDNGIYLSLKYYGIDCLLINNGYIKLPFYEYGFIGGCCFLIDKETLAFNGDISQHKNFNEIKKFCFRNDVKIKSLSDNFLTDCGSIIPLCYNTN